MIFRCAAVLFLLAFILGVSSMLDRDGGLYRIISKLVFPVSKQLVSVPESRLQSDLEIDLTQPLKGWKWFKPELVEYQFTDKGLVVEAKKESVWWKNKTAASLYHLVEGDIEIQVKVRARKTSDDQSFPAHDYQFGGISLRDPAGGAIFGRENYLFNVVGYRGAGLQIETKNTINGYSDVSGYDWSSADAELKIRRSGSLFEMYARLPESNDWIHVNSFERDDLPEVLELGLIVYAFSHGKGRFDLTVTFEQLSIVHK